MSFRTATSGMTTLGKLSFFMSDALARKDVEEKRIEFENHCQGKSPEIKESV